MNREQPLEIVTHPDEFFRDLIVSAIERKRLEVSKVTEFYLVSLMNRFMTTENFFARASGGTFQPNTLYLLYKQAIEEQEAQNRALIFRHLGDVSLYTAGYFQESIRRSMVNLGYYIDMGEIAYSEVAKTSSDNPTLYSELANKFAAFVGVFSEVSDQTSKKSETDLIKIYDQWRATGDERAKKILIEAGFALEIEK